MRKEKLFPKSEGLFGHIAGEILVVIPGFEIFLKVKIWFSLPKYFMVVSWLPGKVNIFF